MIRTMKTKTITTVEAEAEMKRKAGAHYSTNKEWQDLKDIMRPSDELVWYSRVDVYLGFASGDEGISLLRNGEIVAQVVLTIVG